MTVDHLILDLDGTISDPSQGILRSINHALTHFGYPEVPEAEISRYIGPPLDVTFAALSGSASAGHTLELVAKYRERYGDLGYAENRLYEGVATALETLVGRGLRLGVCTSKRTDFAERILEMFDLRDHFRFVSGGDVGISKGMQLAEILADGRAGPGSLMIGDRAVDVVAGRANGLRTIGVLWGHGSRSELIEAGVDRILFHPEDLERLADLL